MGQKSTNNADWRYYNHAVIPAVPPHEQIDLTPIETGEIWDLRSDDGAKPLLARWTSDFDCGYETEWWYCIKDTPFDIGELKSKTRWTIRQGAKNFEVRQINPLNYVDSLFKVAVAAFSAYPSKYRPKSDKASFKKHISEEWVRGVVYGAFARETGELCGYAVLETFDGYANFAILKVVPECEKMQINAAIVWKILEDFENKLATGKYYICDGERNIVHETAFQAYLKKYFGFRNAYCKLNVRYRPPIGGWIAMIYPFRGLFRLLDVVPAAHKIVALLKMEGIRRRMEADTTVGD